MHLLLRTAPIIVDSLASITLAKSIRLLYWRLFYTTRRHRKELTLHISQSTPRRLAELEVGKGNRSTFVEASKIKVRSSKGAMCLPMAKNLCT